MILKLRHFSFLFAGLIAGIAILNITFPRNYILFSVSHVSYLPLWFLCLWTFVCIVLIFVLPGYLSRARGSRRLLLVMCVFSMLSFMFFYSRFPAVHGDGDKGASPYRDAPSLSRYPGGDGRLQSFLSYGLLKAAPDWFRLFYHNTMLNDNRVKNSAWILLTMLCGMFLALLATSVAGRIGNGEIGVGFLLMFLTGPPMLNAYGHFDSYIVPVTCVYLWLFSVFMLSKDPGKAGNYIFSGFSLFLCVWAHPALFYLGWHTAFLIFMIVAKEKGKYVFPYAWLFSGIACGFLPVFVGHGNNDWLRPDLIGWLLHEKTMSCLQVALPALLLAVIVVVQDWKSLKRPDTLQSLSLALIVSSVLMFYTLWVGFGVFDEFLYSVFGAALLGAATLLFLSSKKMNGRLILYAGILSLYLYVPRVYVYSGSLLFDKLETEHVFDRCDANRVCSPYRHFALAAPVDTPEYRARRLDILKTGFENPLPVWEEERYILENRVFYTVWCMEFGEYSKALEQLSWFVENRPELLPELWNKGNGIIFHTYKYRNISHRVSRILTRCILGSKMRSEPDSMVLHRLIDILAYSEATDPAPEHVKVFVEEEVRPILSNLSCMQDF